MQNVNSFSDNLRKLAKEAIILTDVKNSAWSRIITDTKQQYFFARDLMRSWLDIYITEAYKKSAKLQSDNLNKTENNFDYNQFIGSESTINTITLIKEKALNQYEYGLQQGEKTLLQFYALTKEELIEKQKLSESGSANIDNPITENARKIRKNLLGKIFDDKYITILCSDNKERHYNLKDYTELTAKVKYRDAYNRAIIDIAKAIGIDLVKISNHKTACALCAQYENRIYSISGKNKAYPVLKEIPPYHPFCLHFIKIFFDGDKNA